MKSKFLDRLLSIGKFKNFCKNIINIVYRIFGVKLQINLRRVQKFVERFINRDTLESLFTLSKRFNWIIQFPVTVCALKIQSFVARQRYLLRNLNFKKSFLICFFILAESLSPFSDLQILPDIQNITDFRTDRLAFHFIQLVDKKGKILSETNPNRDSSETTLLIIYK